MPHEWSHHLWQVALSFVGLFLVQPTLSQTVNLEGESLGWDTQFAENGANGGVSKSLSDGINVYVYGSFTRIGDIEANRIARWDGEAWRAMGDGTLLGSVLAMLVDSKGALIIVNTSGGVYRWEGSGWAELSDGIPGGHNIRTVAIDSQDAIYVGGGWGSKYGYYGTGLFKLTHTEWYKLSIPLEVIWSIDIDLDNNVYVNGSEGGWSPSYTGRYNGTTWTAIPDYPGPLIISSSGHFYTLQSAQLTGSPGTKITRWNGDDWEILNQDETGSLKMYWVSPDESILTVIEHYEEERGTWSVLRKWDGIAWYTVSGDVVGSISTAAEDANGRFLVGLNYALSSSGTKYSNLALWDGSEWVSHGGVGGNNPSHHISSMVTAGDGSLYVGGAFYMVGGLPASRIAKWDGMSWSTLGTGLNSKVSALAFDRSGNLYAGGYFTRAGEVEANGIAMWDGTRWSALDDGVWNIHDPETEPGRVTDIVIDADGNVIVSGFFNQAGGIPALSLALWNGSEWSALGDGTIRNAYGSSIVVGPDGAIYVGGYGRDEVREYTVHIFRWDSDHWEELGSGMTRPGEGGWASIDDLVFIDGNLYAGGNFSKVGTMSITDIAVWDGAEWSALAGGISGHVRELYSDGSGSLFAAGQFKWASQTLANNVAVWNGSDWLAIDGGVEHFEPHRPSALALESDGAGGLYIGGHFKSAGGIPSSHFAHWYGAETVIEIPPDPTPDPDSDPVETEIVLSRPYPNPSDYQSSLTLTVETAQMVRATIYDLLGREIAVLLEGPIEPGVEYSITVDSSGLRSGLYIIQVVGKSFSRAQKMIITH